MKKLFLSLMVLMALVSCEMEQMNTAKDNIFADEKMIEYYVAYDAENDTRTSLSSDDQVLWSEGDAMNIFFGINNDRKDRLVLVDGAGELNGTFYGPYIAGTNLDDLHQTVIVYPFDENTTCVPNEAKDAYTVGINIPTVQMYTEGSFASGASHMIGVTENTREVVIKTKNVLSSLKLKLKGDKKVSKIVLSSRDAAIAGPASVVAAYGEDPVTTLNEEASKVIELVSEDGVQLDEEVATDFYITLAPCTTVMNVTIYDTEGGYMSFNLKDDAITFKRSTFHYKNIVYEATNNVVDELLNAFKNGGEYKLPVDVTVDKALVLTGKKTLNLDLNGKTLTTTADLSGTNGCIQTTGSALYISNGKIVGKKGYLFVTNGYDEKLHLELTNVDVEAKGTAMLCFGDATSAVFNNVNATGGKLFFNYKSSTPKGSIVINGGKFNASSKVFDFKFQGSPISVIFKGECLFTDDSYSGVEWVESGDAAYPYAPKGYTVFNGIKGYYSLVAALAEATSGDVVLEVAEGEFDLPGALNSSSAATVRTLTIKGAGKDKTYLKGTKGISDQHPGNYAYYLDLKFEDLTFTTANNGYNGGFGHANTVEFKDCNIVGQYYAHSGAYHKFEDCTIDPLNGYLYTYASDCDFVGCTFAASEGKALQVYEDATAGENTVNITNCKFVAKKQAQTWDGKPVTGIDINSNGAKFVVIIKDCTTEGFPKGLNSGSDLWNVKNLKHDITVVVDDINVYPGYAMVAENVYNVYTANGLMHFSDAKLSDVTLNIMANIDFKGAEFKAISAAYNKQLTVNGNGHTISNIRIVSGTNDNTTGQASMFYTFSGSQLSVNDLKIKDVEVDADINGTGYAAVVVGYAEGHVNLNNVDVEGADVYGEKSCGALVGFTTTTGSATMTNCDVIQSSVVVKEDRAGAYIGRAYGPLAVINCTVDSYFTSIAPDGFANKYIGQRYNLCTSCTIDGNEYVDVTYTLQKAITSAQSGATLLVAPGTYNGLFDLSGKENLTIKALVEKEAVLEGMVWANNSKVVLNGLKMSNPAGVQHPNPTNSQYYTTINNQKPIIGAYLNSDIKVVNCEMNIVGPTVYGFYGYAAISPSFENTVFNCNGIRPIANNGPSIKVDGCTFKDQYHYSVRIFENSENRQTVIYTNNTVEGENAKGEFEGINISKKGGSATIYADFTIKGNTENLKYRHHKSVTMSETCTYDTDMTGFAFVKED